MILSLLTFSISIDLFQFLHPIGRRLENEVKHVLLELSQNEDEKKKLLKGRQVDLAEELSKSFFICFI